MAMGSTLTWHGVRPEAGVVHEAKEHEAKKAQNVRPIEELPRASK
jgi:hypothetical protein